MRIAFVKQEVYQDLYVCPTSEKDPAKILFSSQLRVGPIGLMAELNADFYIVNAESNLETRVYRRVTRKYADYLLNLKTQTVNKIPGLEFVEPGSPYPNGKFTVDCKLINWGDYDVVISINISLPSYITLLYKNTLFAYMIGEANTLSKKARFGYDIVLNQMARGQVGVHNGSVDFPYTFLKGDTLEKIMRSVLNRNSKKRGIFMEINSTTERPVTRPPNHFEPLIQSGYEINLHRQKISDNLTAIYDSKYFLKMGGRRIRGNSIAEAISLGVLCMMNRNETIHHELIPDECHVEDIYQAKKLIERLEANPAEYNLLLDKQRNLVDDLFFNAPLDSLKTCLTAKRNNGKTHYPFLARLEDWIWLARRV